jgi:hypothetical protein
MHWRPCANVQQRSDFYTSSHADLPALCSLGMEMAINLDLRTSDHPTDNYIA